MSTKTEKQVPSGRIDPFVWRVAGVVLFGPLMISLDSTIVNVSLSTLGQELHASLALIQWVVSGYLLALALMLPLSGWLVDRIGAKRVYRSCFVGFTMASMLCGFATSAGALIASRVLQGMAGGLLVPMAQLMSARVAGPHLARVMGVTVMPVVLGAIFGPTLAGVILQHASWRWIFYINLPIGIFATLRAAWVLPDDTGETNPRPFDFVGFLLLSPGLVFLLHSLERLSSEVSTALLSKLELLISLGLLAAFFMHGRRLGGKALIDVHLFRRPSFSAAASTQFLGNAVIFSGHMLMPLYLLMVRNVSPTEAGLLLAPAGLGMLCSFPMMGPLTERFGSRRVSSSGAVIALLGTLPFALCSAQGLSISRHVFRAFCARNWARLHQYTLHCSSLRWHPKGNHSGCHHCNQHCAAVRRAYRHHRDSSLSAFQNASGREECGPFVFRKSVRCKCLCCCFLAVVLHTYCLLHRGAATTVASGATCNRNPGAGACGSSARGLVTNAYKPATAAKSLFAPIHTEEIMDKSISQVFLQVIWSNFAKKRHSP